MNVLDELSGSGSVGPLQIDHTVSDTTYDPNNDQASTVTKVTLSYTNNNGHAVTAEFSIYRHDVHTGTDDIWPDFPNMGGQPFTVELQA